MSDRQIYFTWERINACVSVIMLMGVIALLIIPVSLLYTLENTSSKADEQSLGRDTTGTCIGILLVFTLLFSVTLSVFTGAKRHEILGAATA